MTDVIAIQMQYTIHHCLKMTETNFKKNLCYNIAIANTTNRFIKLMYTVTIQDLYKEVWNDDRFL